MIRAIVACGKSKILGTAPAVDLYTGGYYRAMLDAARRAYQDDEIRILSARYGLLRLDRWVETYDVTWGEPGALLADQIALQVLGHRVTAGWAEPVAVFGGRRYVDMLAGAGVEAVQMFTGGIGEQKAAANAWPGVELLES